MNRIKLGLVLSGGGACGAYEVGVLKVLAELELEPIVISGASIGALNGAVVASSKTLSLATTKLEDLWRSLTPEKVIKLNRDRSRKRIITPDSLRKALQRAQKPSLMETIKTFSAEIWDSLSEKEKRYFALLDESPIENLLGAAINPQALLKGREFYVSVFPSSRGFRGAMDDIRDWFFSKRSSEFIRIQDLPSDQVMKVLKASAAIPFFFREQEIGGRIYRDGGLGARQTAQGNTPIEPLIKAGCTHAIVVILNNDTRLPKIDASQMKLIVIRPSQSILTTSDIMTALDFSQKHIQKLLLLGEKDAREDPRLNELQAEIGKTKRLWSRVRRFFTFNSK